FRRGGSEILREMVIGGIVQIAQGELQVRIQEPDARVGRRDESGLGRQTVHRAAVGGVGGQGIERRFFFFRQNTNELQDARLGVVRNLASERSIRKRLEIHRRGERGERRSKDGFKEFERKARAIK